MVQRTKAEYFFSRITLPRIWAITSLVLDRRTGNSGLDWIPSTSKFSNWSKSRNENLNVLNYCRMTKDLDVRLKIEMTNALGQVRRVYYDEFFVGSGPDYELTVGGFSVEEGREIGDHLSAMSGRKFSAKDRDYDEIDDKHCADYYQTSGW